MYRLTLERMDDDFDNRVIKTTSFPETDINNSVEPEVILQQITMYLKEVVDANFEKLKN